MIPAAERGKKAIEKEESEDKKPEEAKPEDEVSEDKKPEKAPDGKPPEEEVSGEAIPALETSTLAVEADADTASAPDQAIPVTESSDTADTSPTPSTEEKTARESSHKQP